METGPLYILINRITSGELATNTALNDAIDSLTFIDLFLDIERECKFSITLDEVVACQTIGDFQNLIVNAAPTLPNIGGVEK